MKIKTFSTIVIVSLVFSLFLVDSTEAELEGGDYTIYSDDFSVISTGQSSGGNYTLYESAGDPFATTTDQGSYELRGGFQAQEKGVLSVNLDKSNVDLGELSESSVSSGSLNITVRTDSETGYTTAVREDGDLRTGGGSTISDVSDGSVTTGSEEYGFNTSGNDALISSDTGLSGSINIASYDATVSGRTTAVTFKASIDSNTNSGSYSHKVYFDTTVNP